MEETLDIAPPQTDATNGNGQPQPPSKKLWQALYSSGDYTKSFDDFSKQFSTPESIDKLHDALASNQDYTKGKDAFYQQYFPQSKKKEPSTLELWNAGLSGSKVTPSDSKAQLESLKTSDDPARDILQPAVDRYQDAAGRYFTLKQRNVSDVPSKQPLVTKVGEEINPTGELTLAQQEHDQAATQLAASSNIVNSIFKSGAKANNYLQQRIAKNGSLNPQNQTEKLAQDRVAEMDKVYGDYQKFHSIVASAVNEKMEESPDFKEQVTALNGKLPPIIEGNVVNEYLTKHKNDLEDISKQDRSIGTDYEDLRDNLETKYPDLGMNVIANKLSKERTKLGYNNFLANFNTSTYQKHNDEIADKILTPNEKQLYSQNKEEIGKMIDTGGVLNEYVGGGIGTLKSIGGSIADVMGQGSKAGHIYEQLEEGANQVSNGQTGWKKGVGSMARFMGMLTTMAATQSVGEGLGLTGEAANAASLNLAFGHEILKDAESKYANNPDKAALSAVSNLIAWNVMPDMAPSKKLTEVFQKVKPELDKVIESVGENEPINSVKTRLADAFSKGIKQYASGVSQVGGLAMYNSLLDKALMSEEDYQKQEGNVGRQIEGIAIANLPIGLLVGGGKFFEGRPEATEEQGAGKVQPENIGGVDISEHSEDTKSEQGLENGIKPSHLSDYGKEVESKNLGKYIVDNDQTHIVSSDVERAKETASEAAKEANRILNIKQGTPLYEAQGVTTSVNKNLDTANIGEDDGKPEGTFDEKGWTEETYKPEGAETFSSFTDRMEKAYQDVKQLPETTHVVAHSKVIRALQALDKTDGKWTDETTKDFLKTVEKPATRTTSVILPSELKKPNVIPLKTEEQVTPTTPPPKEPIPVTEGEEGGKKVSVHHAGLTDLAEQLKLNKPERGEYLPPEWYAQRGRKMLKAGANPDEVNNPNNELHDRISIARAHLEDLTKRADDIAKSNPNGIESDEYKEAHQKIDEYANGVVKKLGTAAHQAMVALQGERDIDTDSFTTVKKSLEETTGKPADKTQIVKAKTLTEKNTKLKQEAQEAEAKLVEETDKTIGTKKEQGKYEKSFKKAADSFRAALKQKPFSFKDENGNEVPIQKMGVGWNDLVEGGAKLIEQTGKVIDGINHIIDKVKDSDWYKKLSDDDKERFGQELTDYYKKSSPAAKNITRLEKELENLQQGIAKQKSPKRELTDREKELKEQINDEREKMGLIPSKEEKPPTILEEKEAGEKELEALQNKFVDKKGNKFSTDEAKDIWAYAKKNYLDKGISYRDMIQNVGNDLGLSWRQVSDAITSPKVKPVSDAMWKKQADYRKSQNATKAWIDSHSQNPAIKALRKVSGAVRGVAVFGHGGIFVGTHAGMTLFQPSTWKYTIPAFFRGWKFAYFKTANYERAIEELKNRDNYVVAQRAGLQNNPERTNVEEYQNSQKFLGRLGLAGERGFNAIKVLRQDLFDFHYNKLSDIEKADPQAVKNVASLVNNATGASNFKIPEAVKEVTFAGGMEAARWGKLTRNPVKASTTALKAIFAPKSVSVADRVFAKVWARRVGEQLGTYTGLLLTNAAIQNTLNPTNPVNLTDPSKPDWLKFKFGNKTLDPTSGMRGLMTFIYNIGKIPFESQRELRGDTRLQALGKSAFGYARGKAAPLYSTAIDFYTQQDFSKNPLPFSPDKPSKGHHTLSWDEYAWEHAPLPVAEAFQVMYKSAQDAGADKTRLNDVINGIVSGAISGSTGFRVGEYEPKEGGSGEGAGAKGDFKSKESKHSTKSIKGHK